MLMKLETQESAVEGHHGVSTAIQAVKEVKRWGRQTEQAAMTTWSCCSGTWEDQRRATEPQQRRSREAGHGLGRSKKEMERRPGTSQGRADRRGQCAGQPRLGEVARSTGG